MSLENVTDHGIENGSMQLAYRNFFASSFHATNRQRRIIWRCYPLTSLHPSIDKTSLENAGEVACSSARRLAMTAPDCVELLLLPLLLALLWLLLPVPALTATECAVVDDKMAVGVDDEASVVLRWAAPDRQSFRLLIFLSSIVRLRDIY